MGYLFSPGFSSLYDAIHGWMTGWMDGSRDEKSVTKMITTSFTICNNTLEISVKSEKKQHSTLSLVIHRVRFKKNLQKSTIAFKKGGGGGKLRKPSILMVS